MTPISILDQRLRETAARLLACAVKELFPQATPISGEMTPIGFAYTFALSSALDKQALMLIEERMRALMKAPPPLRTFEMVGQVARSFLSDHGNPLAAQRIGKKEIVHVMQLGEWADCLGGPASIYCGEMREVKLLSFCHLPLDLPGLGGVSGVRIEGVVLSDRAALKQFMKRLSLAERFDHRKLGEALDLFHFEEGRALWHPKGECLRRLLVGRFVDEAQPVFTGAEGVEELARLHCALFMRKKREKALLPIAYREQIVVRGEGKRGLFDSTVLTQQIEHHFCSLSAFSERLASDLQFISQIGKLLTIEQSCHLVKGGGLADREAAQALDACRLNYVEEQGEVKGVARIEWRNQDLLGGFWPAGYLRLLPLEKGMVCFDEQRKEQPVRVVQRSLYGPLERWVALLLEKRRGNLPFWLAPEQLRLLPIGEKQSAFAERVSSQMVEKGFRAAVVCSKEALAARIAEAKKEGIPCIGIIGEREEKERTVTLFDEKQRLGVAQLSEWLERACVED